MRALSAAALTLLAFASMPGQAAEPAPLDEPPVSVHRENTHSYAGLGLVSTTVESAPLNQSPGGFHVRLGGMLDRHWGAEVRLAAGAWHERDQITPTRKFTVDLDYLAGLYLTSRWDFAVPFVEVPMVDRMFVQGHAGIASVQLDIEEEVCAPTCSTSSDSTERSELSWGVGLGLETRIRQIYPNKIGLSLEYMNYGDKDDIEISAIEAGFQLFF